MNRNAGLRHGLFSAPITPGAVPEAGAPLRPGSWSQCTAEKPRRLSKNCYCFGTLGRKASINFTIARTS
jgi:hypothetical protein